MTSGQDPKYSRFLEENRWELAKSYQARSDHSANTVRTILFTVCAAGIGFILQQHAGNLGFHIYPLATFGSAAAIVFYSWDLQKAKASRRFDMLRDEGTGAYIAKETGRKWYEKNYHWDRIAAVLVALAAVLEVVAQYIQ